MEDKLSIKFRLIIASWAHDLMDFAQSPPKIGGSRMKSIRPWKIIQNVSNVKFLSTHIFYDPLCFQLLCKVNMCLTYKIFNFNDHGLSTSSINCGSNMGTKRPNSRRVKVQCGCQFTSDHSIASHQ